MIKRILTLFLTVLLVASLGSTAVFAADSKDEAPVVPVSVTAESKEDASESENVSVQVSDGVIGFNSISPAPSELQDSSGYDSGLASIGIYPSDIRYETQGNTPIIIKEYQVPSGFTPDQLVGGSFIQDGYTYSVQDVIMKQMEPKTETKPFVLPINFSTEKDGKADIFANLEPMLEHSEGGFSGQLILDYGSIITSETGRVSYSYPVRKTVDITNVSANDFIYAEKTRDGMSLQSVDWQGLGGEQRGDVILPDTYSGVANYLGTGYGSRVTGYDHIAVYSGTLTKTTEGDTMYAIIYRGEKDFVETGIPTPLKWVGLGVLVIIVLAMITFALLRWILPLFAVKKKRKANANVPVDL